MEEEFGREEKLKITELREKINTLEELNETHRNVEMKKREERWVNLLFKFSELVINIRTGL